MSPDASARAAPYWLTGPALVKAKWEVFYDLQAAVAKCKEEAPAWVSKSDEPTDLLSLYEERRQERKGRKNEI